MLPAEKLCTLVTLYHQSQSFVMLEKLDEAIDRAFTDVANVRVFGQEMIPYEKCIDAM